jgi:MoaA/NifB/PqqE/SkfB family radical SAM enzyme
MGGNIGSIQIKSFKLPGDIMESEEKLRFFEESMIQKSSFKRGSATALSTVTNEKGPVGYSLGFPSREMYEFPSIVNVEVYRGDCPCSCVHCPVGTTEPSKRKERFGEKGIELSFYGKIAEEISHYPSSTLRIHSVGEPLLWEELPKALKLSHNKGVKSWIFTCAVTNEKSLLDAICENTSIVEVSVNSTTPEDYKATKGIDAFELVTKNIRYIHELKDKGLPVRLIVSRVQSKALAADEEFVSYWKSTGWVDDAFVRTYHTYNDLLPELSSPKQCEMKHEPCLVHWARFNISVDGYSVVCFNELFNEHLEPSLILGDVNEQTIAEIWQEPKLNALRRAELSSDYSNLPFNDALPCKDCYSCQPLYGNRQTSEHQIRKLKGS